jgi:hypothetical protein
MMVLAVVFAFLGGALLGAALRWRSGTNRLVASLTRATNPPAAVYTAADLQGLPAPVAAYFRAVLHEGQRPLRHATLTQEGVFLLKPTPEGWRPFTATQHIATAPAGFVWDARIRMLPGIDVRVRDAFADGDGSMRASVLGLYSLAAVEGTEAISQGALLRYLAEAVWVPTALLPSAGVAWTAVDDTTALATLTAGSTTVSLSFFFGPDHLVRRIYAAGRMRDLDGVGTPTPWEGRFSDYAERGGVRIPLRGEVGWVLPSGLQTYFRGRVVAVTYE